MKILFIDNKSMQNSIRLGLLEQMIHHDVHLLDDLDEAINFFVKETPTMVLIDFSVDFGIEALNRVLEINPSQHIITISDSLDCSEIMGCDHCTQHHMKKRVLKKSGIHDLIYLIEHFSQMPCEHANKFKQCISDDDCKAD